MDYKKKEFLSYNLHMIKTNKFKTTNVELLFSRDIKKEDITITNFLTSIMTYSTKKYNRRIKLSQKIEDLYAARLFSNCYRVGNQYIVDFTLKFLNDKYGEPGLFNGALDLLHEVVFSPNVENGLFDEKTFDVVKIDEKNQIERLLEDRRKYAGLKLFELTDPNAVFSINLKGYLDDLDKITRANLYEYYKDFINCNKIDIFVIGDIDFDEVEKMITRKFIFKQKRVEDNFEVYDWSKKKKRKNEVIEYDNTNQAKLSISCRIDNITNYERNYVLSLYNIILGGSSDSKFFKNIREKFSLCYYISSSPQRMDNMLTISSGITKENYSKAMILINKEMNDMKKGNISNEEMEKAKKFYLTSLEEVEDNPSQIINVYYSMDKFGLDDIEERKNIVSRITKEQIVELAKKISIDTIFLLGGDKK